MKKRTRKILAFVGLGFAGIFSIAFVVFLAAPKLLNGALGYLSLFTLCCSLIFLFLSKADKKIKEEQAANEDEYMPKSEDEELPTDTDITDERETSEVQPKGEDEIPKNTDAPKGDLKE